MESTTAQKPHRFRHTDVEGASGTFQHRDRLCREIAALLAEFYHRLGERRFRGAGGLWDHRKLGHALTMRDKDTYHLPPYRVERDVLHIAYALPGARGDLLEPSAREPRGQEPHWRARDEWVYALAAAVCSQIGK